MSSLLLSVYEDSLLSSLSLYPSPTKRLSYGTAGFRDKHDLPLDNIFIKMGILACLRSYCIASSTSSLVSTGVMITASHNPECDNGVKIVDYNGGMLAQSWEAYAEEFANANNEIEALNVLKSIAIKNNVNEKIDGINGIVIIGRDTRSHSVRLSNCIRIGVEALGGTVIDIGEVTTPQLHFVVQQTNKRPIVPSIPFSVADALNEYYSTLCNGFMTLRETKDHEDIVIDASAGIGDRAIRDLTSYLNDNYTSNTSDKILSIDIRNGIGSGDVNDECGAEHVQKGQKPPKSVDSIQDKNKVMCSYDGDADRIVFHSYLEKNDTTEWTMFDGDKISVLFAVLIKNALIDAKLETSFSMGIVQTAYANGASTHYLIQHGCNIVMAKTGVKFLHHKAEEFDIGVYFEANGHGTVIFSEKLMKFLNSWSPDKSQDPVVQKAIERLIACSRVINQAVGDAISDMLFVLAAMKVLKLDIFSWDNLYKDLPSKQLKIATAYKSLITCTDDETRTLTPPGLQEALDIAMKEIPMGRCFIRPSGTEDVVRVYAEATTSEGVEILTNKAVEAINNFVK